MIDLRDKKILVTGGNGFIGAFVVDNLINTRGVDPSHIIVPDKKTDDLRSKKNCLRLLKEHDIDVVIHLAAMLGGIRYSDEFPADQYYNNILMDLQVVEAAKEYGTQKVLLVGSSCAYPKETTYPMKESALWDGLPQETNRAYGIGKRILTIQAESYDKQHGMDVSVVIPNNAYGPGDNFDPTYSHVIPSLIRKCVAREDPLIVWGDGTPTRDFLYVKDFAEGVILGAEKLPAGEYVNIGSGTETEIDEVARIIMRLTGHDVKIEHDTSKPKGQPRRSVDIEKAKTLLGFSPKYSLEDGLKETIDWYINKNT